MAPNDRRSRGAKRSVKLNGERLRARREQNDKTQEQLADDAGVSTDTVRRAEQGTRISYDYAQQILQDLKIEGKEIIVWDSARETATAAISEQSKESQKDNFLDRIIDIPKTQTSEDSRFLYNSDRLEFVGRETAIADLQRFCDRPELFCWWYIIGPGGIGKSRLAFHFCRMLEDEGNWKAGFLYITDNQQKIGEKDIEESLMPWETCQPAKPTLIVVDYVATRARFLGKLVHRLAKRAEMTPLLHPVRLLLVERDAEGIWKEDFGKRHDHVVRSFQVTSCHADAPLVLQRLDNDSLWDIIQKMSGAESKDKQHLLEQLASIDPQTRPLFAALVGDAVRRTGSVRRLDQDALLGDVLKHAEEEFWTPAGITDADKVWLCLVTMTGGAFASWLEDPNLASVFFSCEPPAVNDRMLMRRYRVMTGQRPEPYAGVAEFRPLQPDILGEFFVLRFLTDNDNLAWFKQLSLCLNAAWEKRPTYVAEFLGRLEKDFINYAEPSDNSDPLPYFYVAPSSKDNNVQLSWAVLMLNRATFFLTKNGDPEKAVDLCDQMLDCFDSSTDPLFDGIISSALGSKMSSLLKLGRYEEVISVYDIFRTHSDAAAEPYVTKKEKAGLALLLKAMAIGHIGHSEEAIAAFDAVLANFDVASEAIADDLRADFDVSFELRVRPLVIQAICGKAFYLWKLGRVGEAKEVIQSSEFALADSPNGGDALDIKAMLADIKSLLK